MTIEKIIMYDSPEAGKQVTVTAWEVYNPNGILYTPKEDKARYYNCTHKVCECGKPMRKHYTKCEDCISKLNVERYNSLPFREWDGNEPVCTAFGDKYFFSEDEIIEYMEDSDEPMKEIDLLICQPNYYDKAISDYWSDMMPEDSDGELPAEMQKALNELNRVISTLPPQSYSPGKIRTRYALDKAK